jgi:hypothetical protein
MHPDFPVGTKEKRRDQGRGRRRWSGFDVVGLAARPCCGMEVTTVGESAVAREASCAFIAALFPLPRAGDEIRRAALSPHSGHVTWEGTSAMENLCSTGSQRCVQRKL